MKVQMTEVASSSMEQALCKTMVELHSKSLPACCFLSLLMKLYVVALDTISKIYML